MENDNDNLDSMMAPCLQVGPNVELKETPSTAEEYLFKVINERKQFSVVTKCTQDYSKYKENQTVFVPQISSPKLPAKLKPTIEWQNIQVANFSEARMYVLRLREDKSKWPSKLKQNGVNSYKNTNWKEICANTDPTLSSVITLNQATVDDALVTLINTLKYVKPGDSIDHRTGRWIYSLLACTRQPLISETVSILRDLARRCAEIRSHISAEDNNATIAVAPCNLFICLISKYFTQLDLAD